MFFKNPYNYVTRNRILPDHQSGFITTDFTINQLSIIYNIIIKKIYIFVKIFCDTSKAFDRVWHSGLHSKLPKYGIRGNVLRWIECSLYDRKQRIHIHEYFSRWKTVNAGVPRCPHFDLFYSYYSLTTLRMRS